MSCQIHFLVVSGAQKNNFCVYAPATPQSRENREYVAGKWGTGEEFFCICPVVTKEKTKTEGTDSPGKDPT